jgi:FtsP/CotA-like multicopper oxidase with cupredoxin domain
LHGFYFKVDSRGNGIVDNVSVDPDPQVTELVEPGSTFTMTWHADRPGNWLFHCHLAYHIIGHMPIAEMLRGKSTITDDAYENGYVRHSGMGGLILGFAVRPGANDMRSADPPDIARRIALKVEPGPDDRANAPSFRYVLDGEPAIDAGYAIGPPLILTRGVTTAVDVTNLLHEPTAVHWHGMELADSYYDGVAGYSGYGTRRAPMIDAGQTFEAVMTPPRAGTFIYHTHMDDVWQLRGGLAGPLIVLDPGATYDPSSDHVFTITTTHALADALKIFVNGTSVPPAITCRVGVLQRLRFINMTTFWTNAIVSLSAGNHTMDWSPLQIDGANVSPKHRVSEPAVQFVTIGETRDFTFVPHRAGELKLQFWPDPTVPNIVTVPIHVVQ